MEARFELMASKERVDKFEKQMLLFAKFEHIAKMKEDVLPKV